MSQTPITLNYCITPDDSTGKARTILPGALQPADIILTGEFTPTSLFIRAATFSSVSHAMIYVGNGNIVQAVLSGVEEKPLTEILATVTRAVVYRRENLSPQQTRNILNFVRSQKGAPFDTLSAVAIGVSIPRQINQSYYCAELVLQSFAAAAAPLASTTLQARPGSVPAFSTLDYIGHLAICRTLVVDFSEVHPGD